MLKIAEFNKEKTFLDQFLAYFAEEEPDLVEEPKVLGKGPKKRLAKIANSLEGVFAESAMCESCERQETIPEALPEPIHEVAAVKNPPEPSVGRRKLKVMDFFLDDGAQLVCFAGEGMDSSVSHHDRDRL